MSSKKKDPLAILKALIDNGMAPAKSDLNDWRASFTFQVEFTMLPGSEGQPTDVLAIHIQHCLMGINPQTDEHIHAAMRKREEELLYLVLRRGLENYETALRKRAAGKSVPSETQPTQDSKVQIIEP